MSWEAAKELISEGWERRQDLAPGGDDDVKSAVDKVLAALDDGRLRVAEKIDGVWRVNAWVKMAVLLNFRLTGARLIEGGPGAGTNWFDKIPSKFEGWAEEDFRKAGFRAVPGALVRHSAFIGPGAVLMPSFVNVGARIGKGSMIDTWATVGSCAQIGRNVHISGGAGIGGVLEPLQASPVIIEDDCFIGARSEVAEGVVVEEGSVLSMGVYIGASTAIYDRASGQTLYGRVPAGSVVVPGTLPGRKSADGGEGPALYAAIIVKKVDAKTRAKTSINQLLREAAGNPRP
ncbi:MAG: 2,3,4,5-tetrahydropyridine-2,6-dicarboxylate N-succinyltransferase [Sphingomonadales bacterium]